MNFMVYFVSDHTGITVESLGRSLLSQFKNLNINYQAKPFIDEAKKAEALCTEWSKLAKEGYRILVFSTVANPAIRYLLNQPYLEHFDLFGTYLPKLESIFNIPASAETGRAHGVGDYSKYMTRIQAIDFTLAHDDGLNTKHYKDAEIVLVGVSRSGKTPTSLYLAIQYGIQAANYPITEEDLIHHQLPPSLISVREKLFGLLIDAKRLAEIRNERLPGSRYASLEQCESELKQVKQWFVQEKIPYLDTTHLSIEEISTQILASTGLRKK